MKRNLIITADDYGMCTSVNEAIDSCLDAGALRATCVMVNMPAVDAARSLRDRFPGCSVGIHWTLTQGRPLQPPERVPSLVNGSGEFHAALEFRKRWIFGRIDKEHVRSELTAQHKRLIEISGSPEFWNTHENVHVLPGLFQHCVAIGRELGIPAMRCHRRITIPYNMTRSRYHLTHPLHWLKGEVIGNWSRKAQRAPIQMPDGRIHMPGYGNPSVRSLEEVVDRIPWTGIRQAVEVVVHPATRVEDDLFGDMTESRIREYQVLSDSSLADRLRRRGIFPVGFEALLASD